MSFFQRLISYWTNQILVETLANSRTFQRFAISTDKFLKEAQKEAQKSMQKGSTEFEQFSKTFKEEFAKGMKETKK